MSDLNGKILLISGGIEHACQIVEKAREMGIYTIVADYNLDSPAKRISDAAFLTSTTDIDAMVELARNEHVDGVITQFIDSNLVNVQKICDKLGLPFIATAEQLEAIGNKSKAKKHFIKHGLSVPRSYNVSSSILPEEIAVINYPVLTKPVDNSGQRGISICRNITELKLGYAHALEHSRTKQVLVEEYLGGDYVVICFTLQDGHLSLSAMADKPVLDPKYAFGNIPLPKAYIFPSKYLDQFYASEFGKFQTLAHDLALQNGSWGIEAIVNQGVFFYFEMQYRLGGLNHHKFVLQEHGIDILQMHIRHSLTGSFSGWDIRADDNPYFKKKYCLLNVLLNPGTITTINGLDEINTLPGITQTLQMLNPGDVVNQVGTVFQILVKISIEAIDQEDLRNTILKVQETLKVLDENGCNMLMDLC